MKADGEDVSVITAQVNDGQGRMVPTANNVITFEITGPGKIIGVGNGDPSSPEPDRYVESVSSLPLTNWRMKVVDSATNLAEVAFDFDDTRWQTAFDGRRSNTNQPAQTTVYRADFKGPQNAGGVSFALVLRSLSEPQSVYLNGQPIAGNVSPDSADLEINLAANAFRPGKNVIAIVAAAARERRGNRGEQDGSQGSPGLVRMTIPPAPWKRSLFSGLAQVIVQSTGQPGEITLTAKSQGVADGVMKLPAQPAALRAALR
jgi:beta-galactosidase